jgi:serine O-acetyltransferase
VFDNIARDLKRAIMANQAGEPGVAPLLRELFNPGTQAILVHRFGYWSANVPVPVVRHLLRAFHFILQYFFSWRVGIFIPIRAEVGPGLVIHTWGGGVFLPRCRIGRDVTIVGGGVLFDFNTRGIGDEVVIGAGAKVIGKPLIGNRVRIAPNAVVQTDVADDCIVLSPVSQVLGPLPWLTAHRPTDEGAAVVAPAVS